MGFRRSFTQGLKQFAGGLAQGAAQELPNTFQRIDQRNETRHQEGRQDAKALLQAAIDAGDWQQVEELKAKYPQLATFAEGLGKVAQTQYGNQATELESQLAGINQVAQGETDQGRLSQLQLEAKKTESQLSGVRRRMPGAPPMPPAAAPGQPVPSLGMPAIAAVPGRMAPSGGASPTPGSAPVGTAAPAAMDVFSTRRQALNQRDFTRSHLETLRRDADDGVLTKWTDEDMNRIAREMAEANELNPDDPQVLKAAGMQVRELVNRNNEKAKEKTEELVTRQLQNLANTKQIEGYERDRRKELVQMAVTMPSALSQDERDSIGMESPWWEFAAANQELLASPEPGAIQAALDGYRALRKGTSEKDPDSDLFERALKNKLTGFGAVKRSDLMAAMLSKSMNSPDKLEIWQNPKTAAEEGARISMAVDAALGAAGTQGQPGAGDTPEDYAKQIAALKTEDQQAEMALKIVEKSPAGAREIAASPTITSDRIKQILSTGKDPVEDVPAFLRLGQVTKSALGGIATAGGAGISQAASAGGGLTKLPEAYNNFKKGFSQPQPTGR